MVVMSQQNQLVSPVTKFVLSFELALKSLIFSRKWFLYIILGCVPLFFTLIGGDYLLGEATVKGAFLNMFMTFHFGFFFVFGTLMLMLPVSSDEIQDNVIDLFLIRPIRREVLYVARWLALVLANIVVNFFIVIIYYVFYHIADGANPLSNIDVLMQAFLFLIPASLIYSGLFLLVGFMGRRGFSMGVFIAILELFFLSLLFLNDDPIIPRTNLKVIASELFGGAYNYSAQGIPDLTEALLYVIGVSVGLVVAGCLYFRQQQFD